MTQSTGAFKESKDVQFDGQWAKPVQGDQFLLGSHNDVYLFQSTRKNLQLLSEAAVLYAYWTFSAAFAYLPDTHSTCLQTWEAVCTDVFRSPLKIL